MPLLAGSPATPLPSDILGKPSWIDLSSENVSVFRRSLLGSFARRAARYLPETLSGELISLYTLFERGDSFPLDTKDAYTDAYFKRLYAMKAQIESRMRTLQRGPDDCASHVVRNVCHILRDSPRLTFFEAVDQYLAQITRDSFDIAPMEELKTSEAKLRGDVIYWLRRNQIPFSIRPTIRIQESKMISLLSKANGPDFHIAPKIPADKLANARASAAVPKQEGVVALIDCTLFGSAKDCLVFGERAVYFNNSMADSGSLPYSEFPDLIFNCMQPGEIQYGNSGVIFFGRSNFPGQQMQTVFDAIKSESTRKEGERESGRSTRLADLPGMHEIKSMLQEEVIAPLRNPEEFKRYRIEIPNGVLMYGPPGCGKTFIAQHLAADLGYKFFEVSPSDVGSSYVHGTVMKIREIFESASRNAPAMLFVDEFEGMVPARRELGGRQQFKAEEVNEWLVQIGNCAERRILFVAATNEPWAIDDAVKRTGRLDKKVFIGPPDREAISEMLLHHLAGRPITSKEDVNCFSLTLVGKGYSASDLKVLADEAAKLAMKERADISPTHLSTAADQKVPPSISREQLDVYLSFGR